MVLRTFVDANVRCSRATERALRLATDKTLWCQFEQEADAVIQGLPDGATVLDLGGGRRCVYAKSVQPAGRIRLIAVDISPEELAFNEDVSETRVADVATGIPMPDASVDIIFSRALLEHVIDVPSAIQHMGRVLKPGGLALHMVPCRYSLFGMAARALPFDLLLRLLHRVMPWSKGQIEFLVHYDHCYPQALEKEFLNAGFSIVETSITYAQPGYFEAMYPLFILHAIYEWAVRHLRLRRLAAYTVVRAIR